MEKISIIREKYFSSIPHVELMKEIIRTSTVQLGRHNRDDKGRLTEELEKLESLRVKIELEQKKLLLEEQKLKLVVDELANHNETLKELELEKNELVLENDEAQSRRDKLRVVKPSSTDQKILEAGRKKLDYYKVLTGIRWDYPKLKTLVKGFVTNGDDYIHPFSFDFDDKRLESKLWKEIEKSTNHHKIRQSEHDENSSPNEF